MSLFAGVAAATAVPLTALLARGHLAPLVLFALVVPRFLLVDVFGSPDSYAHIAILGAFAVVLAVVWLLESLLRSWLRGWNGGRFTGRADAG